VLVFVGAVGKSAQFPLHVWLPDAMEGPTPVSALIHAATMVAAGVYLVARTYDIFVQSETAMLVVAYVGGFTALMAATMALVKKDIKRVIAYSTVSQLGYMMLGLGIGSYTAGFFHLYNHAFFKALLFLCAGSIITAIDSYNLFEMGGLRSRMPITFWTMVIAGLSLSGIFPFAGFFSKDAIIASTYDGHYYVLFGMALLTVFLTAFYIFRAIFLAFTGEPRTALARGATESPGIMTGPMIMLAFFSVVSGWVGIPEGFGIPVRDYFAEFVKPSEFARQTLGLEEHAFSFVMAAVSVAAGLLGITLAYALYVQKPERARALSRRFTGPYTFLDKGWYFDALYGATFVRGAKFLGRLTRGFDREILVGGLTGGVGRGVLRAGELLRGLQSGAVQSYALFILVGALILAIVVGGQYAALMVAVIALITITAVAVGARL
jgi:NADH-quinone oxidoreductase subunit L